MEGKGKGEVGRLRGEKMKRRELELSRHGADAKRSAYDTEWTRNGAQARSAGPGPLRGIRSEAIRFGKVRSGVALPSVDGADV